jgi:peptidoglycan/LPS O-acetylase OafA/YrhL
MRRVPELDALRAFAALAIIGLHAGTIAPALRCELLMRWGWTGVDFFFVISGCLITRIILHEKGSPHFLKNFYIRRSLRIWPIYYLCLLGIVMIHLVAPRLYPIAGLPSYLTYTQFVPHYWHADGTPFCKAFAHSWSLAVEEQFYLLWPAIVILAGKRFLVPLALGAIVLANVARGFWHLDEQLLVTRCDGLALGALLAIVLEAPNRIRLAPFLGLLSIGSLGYLTYVTVGRPDGMQADVVTSFQFQRSFDLLACNLFFVTLVGLCVCLSGHRALRLLRNRGLGYLGQISYGLYLYHGLVLGLIQRAVDPAARSTPLVLGALAGTLLLAALSWQFVERPILALKERFDYRGKPEAGAQRATRPVSNSDRVAIAHEVALH